MLIRVFLMFILFTFLSCSKPAVNISACDGFQKVSKEYVKCLEDLVNASNTAGNLKEFGKHKTGFSFFKRVSVDPSN